MTHLLTNKTQSILDMSPLKDVHGNVLTLKPGASREVDAETLGNDIVQRMLKPQWVSVGSPEMAAPLPTHPPLTEPEPEPEPEHATIPPVPPAFSAPSDAVTLPSSMLEDEPFDSKP